VNGYLRKGIVLTAGVLALGCATASVAGEPDPAALGRAEAVLSYCAKAAPEQAADPQAEVKELTQGASEQLLARLRRSEEYLKAQQAVQDFVAKVDPHNARRVCSRSVGAHK
jgi:hypothetical protein